MSAHTEQEPAKEFTGAGQSAAQQRGDGKGSLAELARRPAAGGTIAGAVVLGAAALFGALEAAVGAGAGYLAYRVLRRRRAAHG